MHNNSDEIKNMSYITSSFSKNYLSINICLFETISYTLYFLLIRVAIELDSLLSDYVTPFSFQ